jgi:hypothetical protein
MVDLVKLDDIYMSRPFKTRNADEFDLENILDLFIDPTEGLVGPFDFSNSIIKGKMGSGKTMYLRANYAYYLYTLVPCLLDNSPIILPVYIKLSDFQNIKEPEQIYYSIIIKIIEEIVSVCRHLRDADELARLHKGANTISGLWSTEKTFAGILQKLQKYTCEEYVERVTNSFSARGSITAKFLDTYADYSKNKVTEIKRCNKPSFQNIVDACNELIAPFNGKLLLLFDEVGSINKKFFISTATNDSYFETLMNQLRTLPFVRTKLAIYPNSYSDILRETRYGDIVALEQDITFDDLQYNAFFSKTVSLIERYVEKAVGEKISSEFLFDVSVENQLLIEHLINASEGNMRRLVFLLDSSMNEAYSRNSGKDKITVSDVLAALEKQGSTMESQHTNKSLVFLENLVTVCKNRSTYKFTFANKSDMIGKFTNLSSEYNIINIVQHGRGRQSTIYAFDYAYCIYKDIPTHYIIGTGKIEKSRSRKTGESIKRIAQLSDELIQQASIPGKMEGRISFLSDKKNSGFIEGEDGKEYLFLKRNIIKSDKNTTYYVDCNIRFIASKINNDTLIANEIEIL